MRFCFGLLVSLLLLSFQTSKAQIKPADLKLLQSYEDTLRTLSDSIINNDREAVRQASCFLFIRKLVKALKIEGSYFYPFDSLQSVSIVHSPDKKFRIFTWNLLKLSGAYRYYGCIQMNDKKLTLYPLFDYSPLIKKPLDTVCTQDSWYGAMYYSVVMKKAGNKTYYTLFGWKGVNPRATKKVADVLYFDKKDKKPRFGYPLFTINKDGKQKTYNRWIIEYDKTAAVSLNYFDATDQIIFDHLVSRSEMKGKPASKSSQKGYNMLPDGTYEAFGWEKDHWQYIPELQNQQYKEAPVPAPVFK